MVVLYLSLSISSNHNMSVIEGFKKCLTTYDLMIFILRIRLNFYTSVKLELELDRNEIMTMVIGD